MKKYRVNVNGTAYEVEIELIDEKDVANKTESKPASAPATAPVSGDGEAVTAPMPGTILAVNVKDGDSVKKGDVLFVLEAMKMENEIMAPIDGTVTGVAVQKGASVVSGASLCFIK